MSDILVVIITILAWIVAITKLTIKLIFGIIKFCAWLTWKLIKITIIIWVITIPIMISQACYKSYYHSTTDLDVTLCRYDFPFYSVYYFKIFDNKSGQTGLSLYSLDENYSKNYALYDLYNKNSIVKRGINCYYLDYSKTLYPEILSFKYCGFYSSYDNAVKDKRVYKYIIEYMNFDTNEIEEKIYDDDRLYKYISDYKYVFEEFKTPNFYIY